jgi:pyruvate/2-oxoglutarate dehydrogenase complex dihydrolipoamide dehydrogenase (E3) component
MSWQYKWFFCYLVCLPPLAASLEVRAGLDMDTRARRSFDVLILGSGAGGLFAAGAAQMLGQKTALIDRNDNIGGDCTNSACVPSKALRSAASQGMNLPRAREYMSDTVNLVLRREDPEGVEDRNSNLDLLLVDSCRFISRSEVEVVLKNSTALTLQSAKFIIATGASPVVPVRLQQESEEAGIPLFTYRSMLSPESNSRLWGCTLERILVVGGGAAGCELAQSLARLQGLHEVHMVAPEILPTEDVRIRDAGLRILEGAGVIYHRARLDRIARNGTLFFDNGQSLPNVDGIVLCIGRSPALNSLHLDQADVAWSSRGVSVFPRSLRSRTNRRVYAVGDCSDAVPLRSRTATHAAWTAFHAVRNAILPKLIWFGSETLHPCVPRVIYTEPELACVGLTSRDCIERYGEGGFQSVAAREIGTDRADIERSARDTSACFVALRAEKMTGRILGASFCGPSAAEMANTIGMAITNHLTVGNLARSIFSYPSYGYLMHRVALSMHLSNTLGFLEVCGPISSFFSSTIRFTFSLWMSSTAKILCLVAPLMKSVRTRREWEVRGAVQAVLVTAGIPGVSERLISFSDLQANSTLQEYLSKHMDGLPGPFVLWQKEGC